RVQTHDAAGRSSQYSAPFQVGTVTPAPPEIVEVTDTEIRGVGEPGATVEVRDEEDDVVDDATVDGDGTWTVAVPAGTCLKVTATQTVGGTTSAPSAPVSTPACIAAPVIDQIDDEGRVRGTGVPGAT